ncbi:MAG TPA: D-alanyl-D-alanine carboxypeptidase/D-alanyl-D-alanine-endopeptidase [Solirubrobacteraceae bacterium]|nr:D-alanyl-D-alanine carboxypeptidase/D-alanyl-D-alanine-endopeptidase [Solirubrobacteraceae bacterium]
MRPLLPSLAAALVIGLGAASIASGAGGAGGGGGGGAGLGGGTTTTGTTTTGTTTGTTPGPVSPATAKANRALDGSLNLGMRQVGRFSGAYVVDLTANRTLYSKNGGTSRLPASVEKLYTTTTVLKRFGPTATLTTSLLGAGSQSGGTFSGTLYLRGGGDPTFGSSSFDAANYGTGATIQQLVAAFQTATGVTALSGNVVADETMFDSDRGTPATGNEPSIDTEGELSALAFDRGWANTIGSVYFTHPAVQAGQQLVAALKAVGIRVPRHIKVTAGRTPKSATTLAGVHSPPMATLVSLTNTPSDNFFAEMLVKDLGARFGSGGTTAAGAAVVRAQMAQSFDISPHLNDGSGLSRSDLTTPLQVVTLLRGMSSDSQFTASLAVAGETGTLQHEMRGTYAQGRCRGKTGTLHDASNVVGYCRAKDGHTLAFALMMNGIVPDYAHPIQDRMQVALAKYTG